MTHWQTTSAQTSKHWNFSSSPNLFEKIIFPSALSTHGYLEVMVVGQAYRLQRLMIDNAIKIHHQNNAQRRQNDVVFVVCLFNLCLTAYQHKKAAKMLEISYEHIRINDGQIGDKRKTQYRTHRR